MKKAKIMLLAITVLAVVGGALAFKARIFYGEDLCITAPDPGKGCADILPNSCIRIANSTAEVDVINPPNFCFTVVAHDQDCENACTLSATLSFQE